MTAADPLPSPCVGICRIDEAAARCEGCLRTLEEIARWGALGTEEKRDLLAALRERRQRAFAAGSSGEPATGSSGGGIE